MTGSPDDKAKARFLTIQLIRLGGVALVLIALLILNGMMPLPAIAGWALLPIGLIDIFVIPQLLARKWRSPTR